MRHVAAVMLFVVAAMSGVGWVHHSMVARGGWNTKSVKFEGGSSSATDDYVSIGEPADISVNLSTTELTISAWFRTNTVAAFQHIVAKSNVGGGSSNYILGVYNDGSLYSYFGDLGAITKGSASTVAANTWYHAAYTVRNIAGTYTGNIWLNGAKQGSDRTGIGTQRASGVSVRIGECSNPPLSCNPFQGYIDEVTFWSVGFTSTEVVELYNNGHPGRPTSHSRSATLLHWYRMGDGDTYPNLIDGAGGVTGTMTNMVSAANNIVGIVP